MGSSRMYCGAQTVAKAKARIADVQCSRLQFQPGDKVVVRLRQRLERDAIKKLKKSVERWAGDHVEVIVVDTTVFDLDIQKTDQSEGGIIVG